MIYVCPYCGLLWSIVDGKATNCWFCALVLGLENRLVLADLSGMLKR